MPVESTVVSKVIEVKGGRSNSLINLKHVVISKDFISKDQPGVKNFQNLHTPEAARSGEGRRESMPENVPLVENVPVGDYHQDSRDPVAVQKVVPLLART